MREIVDDSAGGPKVAPKAFFPQEPQSQIEGSKTRERDLKALSCWLGDE